MSSIKDFDETLEALLRRELGRPTGGNLPFQLSFAVPDKDFGPISDDKNTLNCYLYDICENRDLRSNQRQQQTEHQSDGSVVTVSVPPPARVKLSYCITAWSPARVTPLINPQLDEHELLSNVLRALLKYPEIPGDLLRGALSGQEPPLPTGVILPSDKKSTSEFWNAIGGQLRPSLNYEVTLALDYKPPVAEGPPVTTRFTHYAPDLAMAESELRIQIGGVVTDNPPTASPPTPYTPIADAWVRLAETGQTAITNEQGQFSFSGLQPGHYTVQVRAMGYAENTPPDEIEVPSTKGNYTIRLTKA
jgi:hypothetical protein